VVVERRDPHLSPTLIPLQVWTTNVWPPTVRSAMSTTSVRGTGSLSRSLRVCATEAEADALAARANRLLARLERDRRPVGSVLYDGGRHRACVFAQIAPSAFPARRPHYE
jgi:hypothetical protein